MRHVKCVWVSDSKRWHRGVQHVKGDPRLFPIANNASAAATRTSEDTAPHRSPEAVLKAVSRDAQKVQQMSFESRTTSDMCTSF